MDPEMVPVPATGRVFSAHRRVRLGDVTASGRLRLDATARYLQDVSNDDTRDSGLDDPWAWLVRRTDMVVVRWPRLDEELTLQTFCGGLGPRWAERRVRITGSDGGLIDAATVWVSMDVDAGRPRPLSASFHEIFGATAGGRRVSARVDQPAIPDDAAAVAWPVRAADLDVLGHVNNAVYWAGAEELLAGHDQPDAPVSASLGFLVPIEYHPVELVHLGPRFWYRGPAATGGEVHACGHVTPRC